MSALKAKLLQSQWPKKKKRNAHIANLKFKRKEANYL